MATIPVRIKLDGEKEYREAIANINQQQKTLKAELDATTSSYDNNTSSQQKNKDKTESLSKQIDLQKQKIQKMQEMVDKASKAYGENDTKTLKLKQSLAQAKTELNKMTQAEDGSVRSAGNMGASIGDLAKQLGVTAAATKVVKESFDSLKETMNNLDDLATTSAQSGFSEDTLQKWQYASEMVDVSTDTIISAARKMKKNMANSPDDFEALGVAVTDASGNMRDAEAVFNDTIAALGNISNETERDQAAMNIFGKSADELAGIIDDGGKSLRDYGQQAEDMGLILSDKTISSVMDTKDSVDQAKASWDAAKQALDVSVLSAFAPVIDDLATATMKAAEGIAALPGPIKTIGAVSIAATAGVLALSKGIEAFKTFKSVTGIMTGLSGSLSGASSALSGLGSAASSVAAPSAAAGGAIGTLTKNALGFVALGGGILLAGTGLAVIADSAIKVASAGKPAEITLVAMAGGVIGLAAGLAVLSPALNAGAIGIGVFGAAVLGIGTGIGVATAGIGEMAKGVASMEANTKVVAEYGDDAAKAIASMAAPMLISSKNAMALAAGLGADTGAMLIANKKATESAASFALLKVSLKGSRIEAEGLAAALEKVSELKKNSGRGSDTSLLGSILKGGLGIARSVLPFAKAMDNGYILKSPTIFGMANGKFLQAGEVGSETVVGTGSLMSMIKGAVNNAVTNNYGGATINVYAQSGSSAKLIANEVLQMFNRQVREQERMGRR